MSIKLERILESTNVAKLLHQDELDKIFKTANDGYEEDLLSRVGWEKRQDEAMKLALQVIEIKNTPWKNAANTKYPLITNAAMRFGAEAYPALVPSPQIFKGRINGFDPEGDKARSAERIGKHMSYQVIEEMDDWEEEMDKLSVSISIVGSLFKKTYFSKIREQNVSELIYPKNLVVNYWTKALKSSPRITHKIHLSDNDIYERIHSDVFLNKEYIKEEIQGDVEIDKAHGIQAPANSATTPHLFKEQHTWIDLDGDGYAEPYIVTFGDNEVARIVRCFEKKDILYRGKKVRKINRTEYFTKYGFIPSPDGSFYDIGFDVLLVPLNKSINTTLNQLHDAGTMAIRSGGFLGRGAKIKGGKHAFGPFEWQQVQTTGDDLRKNIVPLPVREPSQVLFNLLGLLIEAGKELASTQPMMAGQNPGQNQPATTSMAVLEQGRKVFSAIFKRLHRALKHEAKLLKILNSKYLPHETYYEVLDPKVDTETGEEGAREKIYRQDYLEDQTSVTLYSDPNIISELQRTIKAQQIGELMVQGAIPNRDAATKIILESMDLPNVEELLQMPEPPPNPELELEQMKVESEAMYKQNKLQGELAVMDAQIIGIEAKAQLDLAKAEEIDDKIQIDVYKTQVEELKVRRDGLSAIMKEEREGRNERRDVSGMAGKPGD